MRRFAVVTTCHAAGWEAYGRAMVQGFLAHWPEQVRLLLYHEGFEPPPDSARLESHDLEAISPGLRSFKARHVGNVLAHGGARPWRIGPWSIPLPVVRRGERFRWNAVRFAHKCYAIFDAARRTDADVLIWIDADSVFFADVDLAELESLAPQESALACLRRPDFSECGFVAYNLAQPETRKILAEFAAMYDQDLLFDEPEYHDSWLFDVVRARAERRGARIHDIAEGAGTRGSHVLINSRLGRFMDHLKGDRKAEGASRAGDLVAERTEAYWQRPR
ncbi:MAG: hypothetical protein K8R60_02620 [Burkholderiales bacterium]|nr:hypothetical protein [Burkholderiales bacterium]